MKISSVEYTTNESVYVKIIYTDSSTLVVYVDSDNRHYKQVFDWLAIEGNSITAFTHVLLSDEKTNKIAEIKSIAAKLLSITDYLSHREREGGAAMTTHQVDDRASIRTQSNDMEAVINGYTTNQEIIDYVIVYT